MKRCHALRGALELFDYDDPSIGSLKQLLLRAAFAPPFLRAAEGRRFLSHLFTLHAGLTRDLYAILRNQIPNGTRARHDTRRMCVRACMNGTSAQRMNAAHSACRASPAHTLTPPLPSRPRAAA